MGRRRNSQPWDKGHVNGKLVEIAGLHARRLREQALFLGHPATPVVVAKAAAPIQFGTPGITADQLMTEELDDMGDLA